MSNQEVEQRAEIIKRAGLLVLSIGYPNGKKSGEMYVWGEEYYLIRYEQDGSVDTIYQNSSWNKLMAAIEKMTAWARN